MHILQPYKQCANSDVIGVDHTRDNV